MLLKHLLILILCLNSMISANNSFIGEGQRAEIFELTDNKFSVVDLVLPEDEFALLKRRAIINSIVITVALELKVMSDVLKEVLETIILKIKYDNINNSTNNENNILTLLKINEKGYSELNIDDVYNGFDFEIDNYSTEVFLENQKMIALQFLQSNPNFNLLDILESLYNENIDYETKLTPAVKDVINTFTKHSGPDEGSFMEKIFTIYSEYDDNFSYLPQFKSKNATMAIQINGEEKKFNKVTISLGGNFSRYFSKPNYTIKLRGGDELYGLTQFKLRADCNDPTLLRSKLISDIHSRLGLTSVSSSFCLLYINGEFMGVYLLNDTYKLSWIKYVYDDEDSTTLYKCDSMKEITASLWEGCSNENEEVTDHTEWINFLKAVDNATSAADLEDIFEVDHFLAEMALDYLLGSWDHLQSGHNFFMYKKPNSNDDEDNKNENENKYLISSGSRKKNGKWIYLSQDFDHDFGQSPCEIEDTFSDYTLKLHIIDILILQDPSRFLNILKKIIISTFNSSVLDNYIDELKSFIEPYIVIDKTPDNEGNYPGRINSGLDDFYTLEEWSSNIEYNMISRNNRIYGLKFWVLAKQNFVCNYYELECDSNSLSSISDTPTSTPAVIEPTSVVEECWSENLGYHCCERCESVYQDEDGIWGIENDEWCGIPYSCQE